MEQRVGRTGVGRSFKAKPHKLLCVMLESKSLFVLLMDWRCVNWSVGLWEVVSCICRALALGYGQRGYGNQLPLSCIWYLDQNCEAQSALHQYQQTHGQVRIYPLSKWWEIKRESFSYVPFVEDTPLASSTFTHIAIRNKLFNLGDLLRLFKPQFTHCWRPLPFSTSTLQLETLRCDILMMRFSALSHCPVLGCEVDFHHLAITVCIRTKGQPGFPGHSECVHSTA